MASLRTPSVTLVLLLALILPLQGFAAAWSCGTHDTGLAAVQHHCADHSGPAPAGAEHHHCGTCCAAAIALMPFHWTAPPAARSEMSLPLHRSPPKLALDRLDRPPRSLSS